MGFNLSANTKIGWIGTGVMGLSMVGHLQQRGYAINVFNRTKEKANALLEKGANWCDSPALVAEVSDLIFTIVGFPQDVREVYFGSEGIFKSVKTGSICVDMTTTAPSLAVEIFEMVRGKGCGYD